MIYIKSNCDYALTFTMKDDNGRVKKFEFDCFRQFRDTGNIATTGVTPMSEVDFDFMYNSCKQFKKYVDEGILVKTKESGATSVANKMDSLEKENAVLRAQLAEKTRENSLGTNEDNQKLADENASLKKQLEALKKKSSKSSVDVSEDF